MEKILDALAKKVERVLALAEALQLEKAAWQNEKARLERLLREAEAERNRLRRDMETARGRVERLVSQLPEQI
jgi:predicted  nucleic acid-binding Zn-ribbon protein